MIDEEIKKLDEEFRAKSNELFERYKSEPVRDGYINDDVALRRWYESELKRIYKKFSKTA